MKNLNNKNWNWHPKIPIENNPLYKFPFIFKKIIKWYIDMWAPISETAFCLFIAILYYFLHPSLVLFKDFNSNSILKIYILNILIMLIVAGGLHIFFYILKKQDNNLKYDKKSIDKGKKFTFEHQLLDNIFWSLLSGVTIWTLYQTLILWYYANDYINQINFNVFPFLFLAIFFIIILFESIHFYFVHRLLHFKYFYKFFHHIHHRNTNPGPWSGISMHPIEHLLYFSTILIHFFIPSHLIHILFHFMILTIGAVVGHCGFDGFLFKKKNRMPLGHFHHQLHHRYFECNYGTIETPLDVWFNSFHDGTEEATKKIRERKRKLRNM